MSIVATELARNIVLHAGVGGEIIIQRVGDSSGRLDLLAIDKGGGMRNIDSCMRDGFSTAGTAGQGLGAIQRMADTFDIYSHPHTGTAVYAGFQKSENHADSRRSSTDLEFGVISLAVSGETVCGDSWGANWGCPVSRIMVADGLGHGPMAAEASLAAIEVLTNSSVRSPNLVMENIHQTLRATRGAAVSLATIDTESGSVGFVGVGNVAGAVISPPDSVKIMVGHNGTMGAQIHKLQEFHYPLVENSVVIMASDGLATHWRFDRYPALLNRHPALIAAVLYRDANRGRDDVTVFAARRIQDAGDLR